MGKIVETAGGPHFFIIGAMKAATTTLAAQLAAQPGVFMPRVKEPDYFARDDLYALGEGWYARHFRDAPAGSRIGEASTSYAKYPDFPETPTRVTAAIPTARIIYCVRHPIARARSHAYHEIRKGRHEGSLDAAVRAIPALWQYGAYATQLDRWLAHVPKERILIVAAERLKTAPDAEFARVLSFLGVSGAWVPDLSDEHQTAESYRDIPGQKWLIDSPVAAGLRRALVPKSWRTAVRRLRGVDQSDAFSPETIAQLTDHLAPDLARFGEMCGVRLTMDTYDEVVRDAPLGLR